ncbi:MAG: hypothetical protein IT285_06950 [Bdellovibrionales bacterium]|nr:hypothetical protein [Bdellovibrionales bacterium]
MGGRTIKTAAILGSTLLAGCSTPQGAIPLPELPEVPAYVRVPHPGNADLNEVRALFQSPEAPTPETLAACTADYERIQTMTQSKEDHSQAAQELVGLRPEAYHWCLYWQFVRLEDRIKELPYHDERQAEVLKAYAFIVPVARAFREVYQDSRYLRIAAFRYQKVSERIFFRQVALTSEGARDLLAAQSLDPHSVWQAMKDTQSPTLERLGFVPPPSEVDTLIKEAPAGPATADVPAPAGDAPPAAATEPAAAPAEAEVDSEWEKELQAMGDKAEPPAAAPVDPAAPPAPEATAQAAPPPADPARAPSATTEPSLEGIEEFSAPTDPPANPAD